MKNSEQPIVPMTSDEQENSHHWGLTKREYFAGLAMQGLLANNAFQDNGSGAPFTTQITVSAIKYADELLKQLES